jgi:hypothetical protein
LREGLISRRGGKHKEEGNMPLLILVVGFVIGIASTMWFYSHGGRIIVYGKEWGPPHAASTDAPAGNNDTISVTWPKW